MNNLSERALTSQMKFGELILLFVVYFDSLGIPFPITMMIISMSGPAHVGLLDWQITMNIYGSFCPTLVETALQPEGRLPTGSPTIDRPGSWAILIIHFWKMPIAPACNGISGSRNPFLNFLLYDMVGWLFWALLYRDQAISSQWDKSRSTTRSTPSEPYHSGCSSWR